jgi:putative SOS response-associated peptidase YedK
MLDTIANDEAGKPIAQSMRWGLVPFWEKSEKPKIAPINAKSEEIAAKPMFRQAVQKRRCLVPADGFFEWKKLGEDVKQPFHIGLTDGRPFYFAAIFEPGNETRPMTVALLTTRPNTLMETIHTRMPVMLNSENAKAWLEARPLPPDELSRLSAPYPADEMRAVPVSRLVNNPRNDSAELLIPDRADELRT